MPYTNSSKEETNGKVGSLVRQAEREYIRGTVTNSKYVRTSMYEDVNTIDAYINSKHISGPTDSLGREKPFFNIVTAAVNIWYRATDIDRKHIKIKATNSKNIVASFIATIFLQDWMRRENFGVFLNEWGRTLARYGSAIVKFVEQDGRLIPSVLPWLRSIVDPIDFDNNIKIELLELTESQLYKRKYDKTVVENLCKALTPRTTAGGQQQDNKPNSIKVYEVHGEFPLSYLTDNVTDKDTFVQQMHVISFVGLKEKRGDFQDFTLYAGREAKEPNMITHLIKEDGQTLSIGAVKHLFEAQWMINHTAKSIKDQLDLASKLIFQTSDGNFVGQNALSDIETGDILIHKQNQPLTQLQNNSHDIASLQSYGNQWKVLANEINGISESMMGQNAPSGTAWRQVNALLEESHSLFELMTENKGLDLEQMLRIYILPFLKKKMNNSEEIRALLDDHNITQLDSIYFRNEVNKRTNQDLIAKVLKGENPTSQDHAEILQGHQTDVQTQLSQQGGQRFYKPSEIKDTTWKDIFKDLEWDVEVDITGEASFDKEDMATLTTVLQTIATNPRVLSDPNAKLIFNKILSITGAVSPLEFAEAQPFVPQPTRRFIETLDYKDAPDDVKRQIEAQAGLQPSQQQSQVSPIQTPTLPASVGAGGGGLPVK